MTRPSKYLATTLMLLAMQAPAIAAEAIGGDDVIDRVARVLRVAPETAQTWHSGVASLDTVPARLERGLLEALGPSDLRDAQAGLTLLHSILDGQSTGGALTPDGRSALAVVVELVERQADSAQARKQAEAALAAESEAHRQTRDKLDALRDIEQQLDERDADGAQ